MIAIINKGGDSDGICKYELRINHRVLGEFEHYRPNGLAKCLLHAALTALDVEVQEHSEVTDMIRKIIGEDKEVK